ncbi:protein of unknown function [Methylocella tundrae]|uniref:Uncharacterized protein n=1 Tax=Methylocella tundrae TaxID=227605 RepID=A0A4U8Z0N1_METTU|nr:protein of unknown function [Methylocella tundrae]
MLRPALNHNVNGTLEALPCVGEDFRVWRLRLGCFMTMFSVVRFGARHALFPAQAD